MVLARDVVGFETRGPVRAVLLDGSTDIEARAVLVASGVSYRRLEAPGLDDVVGRGIYYGASASEASQTRGEDVYVVGAANSAGQAALNFARYAERVVLVVRGASLEASMSQYLVSRILSTPTIEVRLQTEVVGARGDGHLEAVTLCDRDSGTEEEVETGWLFVFIGAAPRTDWLGDAVARDGRGFVLTGPELPARRRLGAGARAVRPGDERARRLRRRRRPPRQHEAGRLRRRRGRDVGLPRPPLPGDDLTLYDELRALSMLDGLHRRAGRRAGRGGRGGDVEPGEHLFDEGRPADDWWVLLDGRIDLVRRIGHEEAVMASMGPPGQWAGGFRAWDEHGVYMGRPGHRAEPGLPADAPSWLARRGRGSPSPCTCCAA